MISGREMVRNRDLLVAYIVANTYDERIWEYGNK